MPRSLRGRRCCRCTSISTCTRRRTKAVKGRACHSVTGVIVVEASRLQELQGNSQFAEVFSSDNWSNDQGHEYDEHDEVEHGEANDSTLA